MTHDDTPDTTAPTAPAGAATTASGAPDDAMQV
jgi:hypothetical protein